MKSCSSSVQCNHDLFADRITRLMVTDLQNKLHVVMVEIHRISNILGGADRPCKGIRNSILTEFELEEKKKKMEEFKRGMHCIVDYVVNNNEVGVWNWNWNQIHSFISRECRRLEHGLPIYSCRHQILTRIRTQQVMVLVGETGSGKSTQLVQFVADSGVASKSIVCTQPRKMYALSVAQRVRDESRGCYDVDLISCYPSFSSAQQLTTSKIIYMTDHCLVQHYMNDTNLSDVSCIIVDEAHETSSNTNLLFALLKSLLRVRTDLHLIIMSATANAHQLSNYFFGCGIFHVPGRNFPVDITYIVPSSNRHDRSSAGSSNIVASYVTDVVRMASTIHSQERGSGTILAFLTSRMEVEWACENFQAPGTLSLAFHGKQSSDDQLRVFQDHPGKRKVIFATNLAETSLTIPGVKYVIDPGWVKVSKFEPCSGLNILKVCRTSQSCANQRAGRAGRTEPGRCYRLYAESEFELMSPNHDPEVRKVHLGVAILKILVLGHGKKVDDFDFVDAPSAEAVDMAIRNLVQLGAITLNSSKVYELTEEGRNLEKLGIEPHLGKLILSCFHCGVRREGVVLAVLMTNASSVFWRVGKNEAKLKSDCHKVQFCHPDGDLFTLLSVYKQYEALSEERKNKWCWENSISAKTMRRCQEAILELERSLKQELNIIIPSYWLWSPLRRTDHDANLKKCILASLPENVAMFSGYNRLGYEVASNGQHVHLHPSCSLLIFSERPKWVVFGDIVSITNEYLVCVTAIDVDALPTISPPPSFDAFHMEKHRLEVRFLSGLGRTLLKRVCGKRNSKLISLTSHVRKVFSDDCIGIEVNIKWNEVQVFSRSENMEKVCHFVSGTLEYEMRYLWNECIEKCLYHGNDGSSPVALLGAGAKIRHLELHSRYLTVDVIHSNAGCDNKAKVSRSKQLTIQLRGISQSPNLLKTVVEKFGPDLNGLQKKFPGAGFRLNPRQHILCVCGGKDLKQEVETIIYELGGGGGGSALDDGEVCSICLCEIDEDDMFELEACGHRFCRQCLLEQFESAIRNQGSFPICCAKQTCQAPILVTNMRYLLSSQKLEELFGASMRAFIASSNGTYRFCPSPDCPSVYQVAGPNMRGEQPFMCGACYLETCTRCHLEYHPSMSCEQYKVFKEGPDWSLNEWRKDKEDVKDCPVCMHTIEKTDGCNHIQCRCGTHICWICMDSFDTVRECYMHFTIVHEGHV